MEFLFLILRSALVLVMCFAFSGCGERPVAKSWEEVSFPIMTWVGPKFDYDVEKRLKEVADANFTVNYSRGSREANLKALDLAQKTGVKLLIGDSRIRPDDDIDLRSLLAIDSVISDYKDHPALFGYYIRDEPWGKHFENLATLQSYFNVMDPEHMAYTNLFPNYVDEERAGYPTYEEHVAKFMEIVRPRVLSYDHYCITYSGLREEYYENLEIIRKYAMKYSVPFWAFTLSTECLIYRMPTEGHIRFQLYSDLAYGAQGLQYFTYDHIKSDQFYTAPLDSLGNKTPIWFMARNVNRGILAIAPVLRTLRSAGVYHSPPLPRGTRGLPEEFLINSIEGAPIVVGHFNNGDGEQYLMLVNRNYDGVGDVILNVSEEVTGMAEISKEDGSELPALKPDKKNMINLRFEAGDGRLFRVEVQETL